MNAVEEVFGDFGADVELTLESSGVLRSNYEIEEVLVVDMMGRTLLYLTDVNTLSVALNIPARSALSSYIVKVKTSYGVAVKKVVW